jgi:hypothetical protein
MVVGVMAHMFIIRVIKWHPVYSAEIVKAVRIVVIPSDQAGS